MTSKPKPYSAGLALASVLLAGCSPAAAPASTAPAYECLPFPMDRAETILDNKGMTPDKAAAVRSTEHKAEVYYVAIRFHGPGVENEVGIWATTDPETGPIFAVDGFAHQFSDFPQRDEFSHLDPSAEAAANCVS